MFDFSHSKNLSKNEWEEYQVRNIQTSDMMLFNGMPYDLSFPIRKSIQKGGHPFAYIDLSFRNQEIARSELQNINQTLRNDKKFSRKLVNPQIQVDKIHFVEYNKDYGYTRIFCNPYTKTGKTSKFPFSLFFSTRLDDLKEETHGELFYGKSGHVEKALVCIWNGKVGEIMSLKIIDGILAVGDYKKEKV